MDMLKELISILGGGAIGVAAIAWLAKSLLTHFLSKDIQAHKARLDAQNTLELERLRSDLVCQATEHEITFRRVDEKVAGHLAKVYEHLFRLYTSVSDYVKIMEWPHEPSKEEKLAIADAANKAFWEYFLVNRVYVPPKLYARTREVAGKLTKIANDFTDGREREKGGAPRNWKENYWDEAFDAVEKEATPLFTAFVSDVQKRLGVTDTEEEPGTPDVPMGTPRIEQRKETADSGPPAVTG